MILVFGAGGFIGTYLVDHLVGMGRTVLAADINELGETFYRDQGIPYRRVDITQRAEVEQLPWTEVTAVVNLACVQPANVSEARYDPADFVRVNVLGTLNVLACCRAHGVRKLIYTCSHRNTQGMWPDREGTAIAEGDGRSIKFTGDYAMFSISESAAADCVEHYVQSFGLEGIVLRLPPVYGFGPHTVIFKDGRPLKTGFQVFIENALEGRPIEVWGDASKARDIVYVKDVVSAVVLALDARGVTGLYNISSGRALSLREQAECIARVFERNGRRSRLVERPDKPNTIESYFYDISKAKRDLGWAPRYSFEEMLRDYQAEQERGKFAYLVEKRRRLMLEGR